MIDLSGQVEAKLTALLKESKVIFRAEMLTRRSDEAKVSTLERGRVGGAEVGEGAEGEREGQLLKRKQARDAKVSKQGRSG